ncbi:MAG: nuclear transport factor 2 family protein [Methylocystis sp.]|uniref:nuclear transport factor 2 family protein n=1 Tax=Methylocystis sp. TaxID=1911079 RepID=UPI003DA492A7
MHPNEQLLRNLFDRLNAHDADGVASYYDDHANFKDIAFTLTGKKQIYAMWHMICSKDQQGVDSNMRANIVSVSADDLNGQSCVEEHYFYGKGSRRRPVHNRITSEYLFSNGRIIGQKDHCDAVSWANQALGGIAGFLAGRFEFIRRFIAMRKVKNHLRDAFTPN